MEYRPVSTSAPYDFGRTGATAAFQDGLRRRVDRYAGEEISATLAPGEQFVQLDLHVGDSSELHVQCGLDGKEQLLMPIEPLYHRAHNGLQDGRDDRLES